MNRHVLYLQVLGGAAVLASIAGCGPGVGNLAGKITYQDKTVVTGSILVKASNGLVHDCKIGKDGSYHIDKIVVGEVEALVNSPDPGIVKVVERKPHPLPDPEDRAGWFEIPPHFGDFKTSGLKFQMKSGPNTWDIDLK